MAGVPCVVSNVIPDEADLGIGLLHSVSLEAGPEVWVDHVMRALQNNRPDWNFRKEALKRNGYDVKETVKSLIDIYRGRT
jgi:glycosyltransferase EpsF